MADGISFNAKVTGDKPFQAAMEKRFDAAGVEDAVEGFGELGNGATKIGESIWNTTKGVVTAVTDGVIGVVDGTVDIATGAVKYTAGLGKAVISYPSILMEGCDNATKNDKSEKDDKSTEISTWDKATLSMPCPLFTAAIASAPKPEPKPCVPPTPDPTPDEILEINSEDIVLPPEI